jgi:hypothetical protein
MKKNILLLFFIPLAVIAQDMREDARHQQIIISVLQQINEYESASSFANERRITQFQDLFVNLNTQIINDIPAMGSYESRISVEQYIKNMRVYYSRIGVDIDIHEISKINFIDDNKGDLSVFLTKKVYGENAKHKIDVSEKYEGKMETFSEYVNYEDEFELEVKFQFNNKSVLISDIILTKPKGKLLVIAPHWKRLSNRINGKLNPKDEMNLIVDGKEIQLPGYYYSIRDVNSFTNIQIKSNDNTLIGGGKISLKTYENTDESHLYKLPFTKTIGDFSAFVLLSQAFPKINSNIYNANITSQSSNSFGASLSYEITDLLKKNISKKQKQRLKNSTIYIKASVVRDNLDYQLNTPSYTESYASIDPDGGNYLRTLLLENYTEQQLVEMQTVFGQLELRFKRKLTDKLIVIVAPAIGMGQVTVNSATFANSADATYSGYYDDLFGITIAENGVYDFGDYSLSQTGNLESNTDVNTLLVDLGLLIKRGDRLMANVGISYTKYQSNIFSIGTSRISENFNELNTMNNLIDVNMDHISLKLGLSYKF